MSKARKMPASARTPGQRQLRVGEELRHAIAHMIERGEFRDPDLQGRAITVTEVRVSPDLRNATIFIMPLGGGDCGPVLAGLGRATPYLRHELGRMIQLRLIPDLHFLADTSFDEAGRIDALLRLPEVRRDLDPDDDGDAGSDHGAD